MGLIEIVFIVFMILKLTGNIDWSWWWVSSPLFAYIPILGLLFISRMQLKADIRRLRKW